MKLSLIKAAEDDKNAILMELERFKKMCKDSEETISSLVSTNKTQSNALDLAQFELVACREQQDKTNTQTANYIKSLSSRIVEAVSQQEVSIRSLQNHVTTVQSNEIERLQRIQSCLDMHTQRNESESNTTTVEMNQRYELEIHSLKYELAQALIDCQHRINEITMENKKVEEALRIKNEVTYTC